MRSALIDLLIPHSHPQVTGCMNFQRVQESFRNFVNPLGKTRRGEEKMRERSGVPRYLKLTIAVGSRYRKNKRGASPSLSFQSRASILSRFPPHHDHPQAVSSSLPRGKPTLPLLSLPPCSSSPRGIRRLTSLDEKRSDR